MPEKEFHAEKMYQMTRSIAMTMLKRGIINATEYARIDAKMLARFKPAISSLLAGKSLT